jgi:hypothetical protein
MILLIRELSYGFNCSQVLDKSTWSVVKIQEKHALVQSMRIKNLEYFTYLLDYFRIQESSVHQATTSKKFV